tara:strand:+ start:329 stop:982 length:654 start_codon:yes stop_codon:yes gene_type:complete
MIISHKYKFIFIANPKTATQYVRKILEPFLDVTDDEISYLFKIKKSKYSELNKLRTEHIRAVDIKNIVGNKIWNTYFKFSFIRNPYTRFVSIFLFNNRNKKYYSDINNLIQNWKENNIVLKEFKNMSNKNFFKKTQSYWFTDENENLMIDFIGDFDNLDNDLKYIFNKCSIGKYSKMKKINSSISHNYKDYLNNYTIKFIDEYYKKDFYIINKKLNG